MQHAVSILLESELFTYHYDRMVGIMMGDAQEVSYILQLRWRLRCFCDSESLKRKHAKCEKSAMRR
jgi:hypothetical protein